MTNTTHTKTISANASPWSVTWASFVAPIHNGTEPHLRHISLRKVDRIDDLAPLGSITATIRADGESLICATHGDASMLAAFDTESKTGDVWVRAATEELADKLMADVKSRIPPIEPDEEQVSIDFIRMANERTVTWPRPIETPDWSTVEKNYPSDVVEMLGRMSELTPSSDDGRIVLWHGPPGTGKTSAIRALAKAWQEKIDVQVLLDPEQVLSSTSALVPLLLQGEVDRWRMLVIEDADELLRIDAKERVGQALSRLLNLSDGLLGQGTKVLVLITTNEPIGELHPAIVRPGRCLVECNFRRFTRAEALARAGGPLPPGSSFSLAELTAIECGNLPSKSEPSMEGLYL